MSKKVLMLIMLSFSVGAGGFWVLQAQDPQNPSDVRRDPPVVSATTQTDLSGTYTGTFNCEPLGLMGPTTLTITGNDFTTADGKTGRIVASQTAGYMAVVLQVGGTTAGGTGAAGTPATAPVIVSMRGRKAGNRLILTPVSGTTMRCSFTPGRATARGRRNQPADPATPAATGTVVANPAASPTESPSPMPEQTPSPNPSPTVTPTPSPEPTPNPSPEPMPSPTPGGSPMPTPNPSPGEPMPTPSPGSSPTPSPSPRL